MSNSKEDSYSVHISDGRTRFKCLECGRLLSRKQRILTHLVSAHNKSPCKRATKRYLDDPSNVLVPKRTLMRHNITGRMLNAENDGGGLGNSGDIEDDGGSDIGDDMSVIDTITDDSQDSQRSIIRSTESDNSDSESYAELHVTSDTDMATYELSLSGQSGSDTLESLSGSDTMESSSDSDNLESSSDSDTFELSSDSGSDTETANSETDSRKWNMNDSELHTLMILSYIIKHNVSMSCAKDLVQLLQAMLPESGQFKTIQYSDLLTAAGDVSFVNVHYCPLCKCRFPDNPDIYLCSTANCNGFRYKGGLGSQIKSNRQPRNVFVMADVKSQLTYLLERKGVWEQVKNTKAYVKSQINHPVEIIHDITDGEMYRAECAEGKFLSYEGNLSAVYNSDGIPLYSSSGVKLWPIYLAVNELDISVRFLRENMILAAIWQGKDAPPFLEYFYAFSEEMCKLYIDGFTICPPSNQGPLQAKIGVFLGCLDLQAKGYILNMTMHNGQNGCVTCEEPGESVRQGKGYSRHYPYRPPEGRFAERKSDDVTLVKGPAATRNNRLKGVCGITGLAAMPWFDVVLGTVPDYMHGILLGITKTLMYKWFSSTQHAKPHFVGGNIKAVSQRLQNIRPPDYVESLPRDLEKHSSHFKATELQAWLLFYAIPCLNGFLPHRFLQHFACLSEATHILLRDNISIRDLDRAEGLLDSFYSKFATLYGEGSCGLNVHNVGVHLVQYVRLWGPLFAWSCFGFEDWNAALLSSVHGTGDVTKQILHIRHAQLKLSAMPRHSLGLRGPKETFLHRMTVHRNKSWSKKKSMSNCCIAGATTLLQVADGDADYVKTSTGANSLSQLRKALRIEVNKQYIYAKEYSRMQKRICYVVRCQNTEMLAICYFIVNVESSQVFALGERIEFCQAADLFDMCGHHLLKVSQMADAVIVNVSSIVDKLFFIDIGDVKYVSTIPNRHGKTVFM